ncbi:MAG: hypothetical protein AB7O62_15425 [Pirellulales bacterium]
MNPSTATTVNFPEILKTARQHLRLWGTPALAFVMLGLAYCQLRQPGWKVTQALVVREEASGGLYRQGRFDNVDAMKTVLETVQEVARSRAVIQAALEEIGPSHGQASADWPSFEDITRAQAAIQVKAPKGAEFGKTEVIHLITTAGSNDRALRLNRAVSRHLQMRFQELRETKARSIIEELEQAVRLAEADQTAVTQKIEEMEREVGVDLGELRTLNELGAGESNLRSATTQIKNEMRQARTNQDANQQLLEQLKSTRDNPEKVTALSGRLLEAQPALRRLKDGLIDAQLRTAEVLGKMSPQHPLAAAAMANEEAVRQDLRNELGTAIVGLAAEIKVGTKLLASYERQLEEVEGRLQKLAGMRARYANLAEEVRQRGQFLEKASKDLADAKAAVAAAQTTSLITLLDAPEANDRPAGPGNTTILAACGVAGLASGFGLLFLMYPLGATRGRRWNEIADLGRRATDFLRNRRSSDSRAARPASGSSRRAADRTIPAPDPAAGLLARRADDLPAQLLETGTSTDVDRRRGDRRGS